MSKESGTRSGLLWQVERILDECEELPQVLLMENVKAITSRKNINDFKAWQLKLEQLGYKNFIKVLNAKNYGVPQNRERCFMVSILSECNYLMPKALPLKYRLKDLLELNVNDKYYLSDKMLSYLTKSNTAGFNRKERFLQSLNMANKKGIATTINTNAGNRPVDNFILNDSVNRLYGVFDKDGQTHQAGSVYDTNGLAPTLDTMQGGYRQPCIEIIEATKKGYAEAQEGDGIDISSRMKYHRGNVQKGKSQTITTSGGNDRGVVIKNNKILIIRKLTPNECWRLMGVKDADYNNVAATQSDTSLYHLAGDSIVTTVLMAIFGELLGIDYQTKITELVEELKECI